jgi:hypothetical protein
MKVTRPQTSKNKISTSESFELCYLRHRYLRKSEYNPSPEEMKPYLRIVERLSRNTFYRYRYVFSMVGLELDDVIAAAKVHLVSFICLFELSETKNRNKYEKFCIAYMNKNLDQMPDAEDLQDKNKAIFTLFLEQRMTDMIRICIQKAKNIKGIQIDEYLAFFGPKKPPKELKKLLENHTKYGFKKVDNRTFKAIKKRVKADLSKPFKFAGSWYVAVPLGQRNLTALDFEGAGFDPRENTHNMTPERLLQDKEQKIEFDKKALLFNNGTKEEKVKTLLNFIEKNEENPTFEEEIHIAKRFLKRMGMQYVR